ncbi:hypothetical protein NDU88_010039 [Pleurodeles waltl]|uniref:Uncharacterized protein n=1 Tax=Pleurodeles waltl TaxID=8319 RepID=A0AAV7QXG5_PLEWA|nr:hypothetical protein NDU88_010039 [Pleurodeles waltl]
MVEGLERENIRVMQVPWKQRSYGHPGLIENKVTQRQIKAMSKEVVETFSSSYPAASSLATFSTPLG